MTHADRILPSDVKKHLSTRRFGRRIYYYPETDSTNRVALELARRGESEGTVVITDFQTKGEGRQNRTWYGAAGKDLLFTLVLRPDNDLPSMLPVTLVFSAAVAARLTQSLGIEMGVKWPNDMVTPKGKIGGILAKGSAVPGNPSIVVVGIGLNVNSDERDFAAAIRGRAASCRTLTGRAWDRGKMLADVLDAAEDHYDRFRKDGFSVLREHYEEKLALRGQRVYFERGGVRVRGTGEGVNDDGALRLNPAYGGEPLVLYNEEVRLEP
ncbi:MAG: biotin--[acetyl-CoA-carboxylase] ligase [Candidatus Krumholzibacteria bacterium]|nr:biotin--[acetyl-CoA-carboxylase] ligase [Candidatus Krumholzibacteria bacterium]